MRFTSLGSGSKGNSLLVSTKDGTTSTTVMMDCGFGVREITRRLKRVGCEPADLSAIVVTHEHSDHVGSALTLARRYRIPLWMSYGTFQSLGKDFSDIELNFCRDGDSFSVNDFQIDAFTISHDAREPLQFSVRDGRVKFGMLTDTGQITSHISNALQGCDALMIECNYDEQMLAKSVYPFYLKKRISSIYGHLSNDCAAGFLDEHGMSRLKTIVAAHLSQNNNLPELVKKAIDVVVGKNAIEVVIATQDTGFEWMELTGN